MHTSETPKEDVLNVRVFPPGTRGYGADDYLRALASPWYRLVADVGDTVTRTTLDFAHSRGVRVLNLPITTRTVTCPTGLGSDSRPVRVSVDGVDTYLADSMQFLLEYGCRISDKGCCSILPSFRADVPDATHLGQFVHIEAEIPSSLDEVIDYVEAYLRVLAAALLDERVDDLVNSIGDISHLEQLASGDRGFERLTFSEAARLLTDDDDVLAGADGSRTLSSLGERRLVEKTDEFVWVTHFDHLGVPFYQAFIDDELVAVNADLLCGVGELVGAGQRHVTGDQVRRAMACHEVLESDYAWYVRMKDEVPMLTSGFGLGFERFMVWVLRHDDIRDIPLVSRIAEPSAWPNSVDRP